MVILFLRKIFDSLLSIAFWCCILGLVWLLLQVTGFTSFRIPTDSMMPTLQPGDHIFASAEGEEVKRIMMGIES